MSKPKTTICVLLYGNYPQLADRCLRSIAETVAVEDLELRVGLNQVARPIVDWVRSWLPAENIWEVSENLHKYPLMRQMVHGIKPVTTKYLMWFDDDSYLDGYQLTEGHTQSHWLHEVEKAMEQTDLLGSVYKTDWRGAQREFVRAQPWYTGKDPAERNCIKFVTGGWWVIRTDLLYKYNYPWPELDHNGGDVMLGELCHQQSLRITHYREGVKINADAMGRESKATRRGFTQSPLGVDFDPGIADALHRATTPRT
jgi:hypothetical protein